MKLAAINKIDANFWWIALTCVCVFSALEVDAKENSGYVSAGLSIPNYSLDISRKQTASDNSEMSVVYTPNLPLTSFVGLSLFGVTLKASADIPGTKQEENVDVNQRKVKTDYSSYSASYFFDRIGIDGSYTQLKGMNLESVTNVSTDELATSAFSHRSDIELIHETVNLWLAPLSFNLSLDDFFDLASKPRGCGFGIVAVGSYDVLDQTAESALIPIGYRSSFGSDQTLKDGRYDAKALQLGPAFVLDFHGLFLEGLITIGQGSQTATYQLENDNKLSSSRGSDKSNFYLAFGYKGQSIFTGFDFSAESPGYYLNTITIATERSNGRWIVGARF